MSVTLDQLLSLTGRLDDARGYDTSRERLRRFLREYVTDVATLSALVDECRHAPDDQHRRALADLVTLAGRFLGFDVAFGVPVHVSGRLAYRGTWLSPGRLRVVVDVGSPAFGDGLSSDALAEAATALDDSAAGGVPAVGLAVTSPLHAAPGSGHPAPNPRVRQLSLDDVLVLAERAGAARLDHADVVRMLESGIPVDFVVGLLDRRAAPSADFVGGLASDPVEPSPARRGSGYWMATVAADYATTPEEFLELVVAKRHVFGVTDRGTVVGTVQNGDSICFYLPAKGVVGHARVASVTEGAADLRDARRFRQVLRLEALALHLGRPVALDPETELRLRAAPAAANRHAQILLEIAAESFRALSAPVSWIRSVGEREAGTSPEGARADAASPDVPAARDRLSG